MSGAMELLDYLKLRESFGSKLDAFIIEHGREFKIGLETFAGRRGRKGLCFMNAAHKALFKEELIYCEGYTMVYGVPIEHAWVCTKSGELIDPTLDNKDGRVTAYYGVPFTQKYLLETLHANGVYGLFGCLSKSVRLLLDGKVKNFREEIVDVPSS